MLSRLRLQLQVFENLVTIWYYQRDLSCVLIFWIVLPHFKNSFYSQKSSFLSKREVRFSFLSSTRWFTRSFVPSLSGSLFPSISCATVRPSAHFWRLFVCLVVRACRHISNRLEVPRCPADLPRPPQVPRCLLCGTNNITGPTDDLPWVLLNVQGKFTTETFRSSS